MAKKDEVPVSGLPKIGWPCVVHTSQGLILGICVAINSRVRFGEKPPVVEEVTVFQIAQKTVGEEFFELIEGEKHRGEIVVEAAEVTSVIIPPPERVGDA